MQNIDSHILLSFYFIALLFVSFFLHRFLLNRSTKYNIKKANQNGIRWGKQTKPVSGGIVFFAVLLFSSIIYMIYEEDVSLIGPENIYIGAVLLIAFFMGLADDMINTSPYLKFAVQIVCGIILIRAGVIIEISNEYYFNIFFTILWIVGIMNSINMLDNMDAITTITSISILIAFIAQNLLLGSSNIDLFVFLALLASLLSFLYFNWHPSKMYMGDNGSQLIGAFLGTYSIIYFWNCPAELPIHPSAYHSLIIFLLFLIPITDTTTVTINRLLKGKSPFVGGRDHTTHFFVYRGFKERTIAIMYFILNLISVTGALLIVNLSGNIVLWLGIISGIYGIFVLLIFYINTRITKPFNIEKT